MRSEGFRTATCVLLWMEGKEKAMAGRGMRVTYHCARVVWISFRGGGMDELAAWDETAACAITGLK